MEDIREIFHTSLKKASYPICEYDRKRFIQDLKRSAENMETEKIFYFWKYDEGKAVAKMLIDENLISVHLQKKRNGLAKEDVIIFVS